MPVNHVIYDNKTLIDLRSDTVTEDTLLEGATAHDATGARITGRMATVLKNLTIDGTSYNGSEDVDFTPVIEAMIAESSGGGGQTEYDPVFANNSWEAIIDACGKSAVPNTWVVGNSKAMTIGGTDYFVDIIGKNHDTYATGGVAPLTLQMRSCYETTYTMNSTGSNVGGWADCSMRNSHLPEILSQMPEEVRANVKEVNKMTSVGNASTSIGYTADKLFLLSEAEVFGTTNYSAAGEGNQYAYYSAGNSAVKELGGAASYWWLRSPRSTNATAFCRVNGSGSYAQSTALTRCGVAFAFCF